MDDAYWLFVVMVVFTVSSPGPGVLMTLDNAVAAGWRAAMQGVLGLALGAAVMAGLSSAGIGLLIRSSPPLFQLLKYAGVAYLFHLSFKTWRRDPKTPAPTGRREAAPAAGAARKRLLEGALLQTSNPKSLFFFLSVLPQVAHGAAGAAVATYCIVLVLIHGLYAGLAARAGVWLSRPGSARLLSRLSALMFFAFGVTMLTLTM
ncbi:LysE family transporter [Rugamonas sp. FT107W]|uniref:LysE family transporter n=1 Tax=Duganella vulcania TaxID=2692166 RepID=A0A845HMX5_9BURK|nr:LysE family translocator [Duganella vulcania]MYN19897.1 LysE family transporter [Duganella vulcania]